MDQSKQEQQGGAVTVVTARVTIEQQLGAASVQQAHTLANLWNQTASFAEPYFLFDEVSFVRMNEKLRFVRTMKVVTSCESARKIVKGWRDEDSGVEIVDEEAVQ